MANKCAYILQREIGRDLCLVRRDGKRKGYRKNILTDNLLERDAVFFCNRCQGIMKEVCTSSDGEQLCSCCKKKGEQTHPNIQMDNMILSFKCSCPLIARGCKWLGLLGGCQKHLDTCGYVYETCKLRCGVVLQRNKLRVHDMEECPHRIVECEHCINEFKSCELHTHLDKCPKMEVSCDLGCGKIMTRNHRRIHVTDTCVQRLIQCEHCKGDFKFCDMSAHLDVCPKMEVSCELKCGVVMCREVMTQHLEVDCPEKAIECPYAKYKCVGLIKRKDMSKHLEERRVEHLEWKLLEQEATIETMSQEIRSLKKDVKNINSFHTKLEWIANVPKYGCHTKNQFLIAGYQFEFDFCSIPFYSLTHWNGPYYSPHQIRIRPQNGLYYEKLKWPFKAEFTTRLRSKRNPTVTKEFKSEVIVVERKDFNSDSNQYFKIVTISYSEYREIVSDYLTDDVAEFEIFVVFL